MRSRALSVAFAVVLVALPLRPQFRLSGYLSAQYEKGGRDSDAAAGTFAIARAGLLLSGKAETVIDYALEVRFKSEDRLEIEEAWVGVSPTEAFHLKLGLYLVPFGKYNTANRPHQTLFIKPPLSLEQGYPASWRDIGVLADGSIGFFRYAAYLGNGLREEASLKDSQQFRDNNGHKSFGCRVGILLSRTLEFGLSYCRGSYDDADERTHESRGLDLSWDADAFLILYEYVDVGLENPSPYSPGREKGHFGLLALRIGELSPFVGYQTLDYEDSYHGPGFGVLSRPGEGQSSHLSRWAIGLSYLASSGLRFKIEYDLNREEGMALKNNSLIAQAAFQF